MLCCPIQIKLSNTKSNWIELKTKFQPKCKQNVKFPFSQISLHSSVEWNGVIKKGVLQNWNNKSPIANSIHVRSMGIVVAVLLRLNWTRFEIVMQLVNIIRHRYDRWLSHLYGCQKSVYDGYLHVWQLNRWNFTYCKSCLVISSFKRKHIRFDISLCCNKCVPQRRLANRCTI